MGKLHIAIALVFLAIAVLFNYWPPVESPGSGPTEKQITGMDVAKMSIAFAESMRSPEGGLYLMKVCDAGECHKYEPIDESSSAMLFTVYRDMNTASGSGEYAKLAEREFETMVSQCRKTGHELCEESGFTANLRRVLDGETEFAGRVTMMETALKVAPESTLENLASSAEALAIIYQLNNDQRTLESAMKKLEKMREYREKDPLNQEYPGTTMRSLDCMAKLAEIRIYTAANDSDAIQEVMGFFDDGRFETSVRGFNNLDSHLDCQEALIRISEITGNDTYKKRAATIFQDTLKAFWDTPKNKLYEGDYGFYGTVNGREMKYTMHAVRAAKLAIKLGEFPAGGGYY